MLDCDLRCKKEEAKQCSSLLTWSPCYLLKTPFICKTANLPHNNHITFLCLFLFQSSNFGGQLVPGKKKENPGKADLLIRTPHCTINLHGLAMEPHSTSSFKRKIFLMAVFLLYHWRLFRLTFVFYRQWVVNYDLINNVPIKLSWLNRQNTPELISPYVPDEDVKVLGWRSLWYPTLCYCVVDEAPNKIALSLSWYIL